LTPIFSPASPAMVVMRDLDVTTSVRVFGAKGGGLGQDAERGARSLCGDVADVAPCTDVDLAFQLVGDDRLGARCGLDPDVQSLLGEQSPARTSLAISGMVIARHGSQPTKRQPPGWQAHPFS
jgi:hypothetical protein